MHWIRKISLADYLTITNGLLGFLSITYVIDGKFLMASFLIFLCIVIDGLDGAVARYLGSKHEYGQYLDSFSDTISFCFAPAALLYSNFYDISRGSAWSSFENALAVLASAFVVVFGVIRLARFAEVDYHKRHFLGLPTPANAFLLALLLLLLGKNGLILEANNAVPIVAILTSLLMISNIPYPKAAGEVRVVAGVGISIVILSFLLLIADRMAFESLSILLFVIALLLVCSYVIGGPLYVRKMA